jgi:hypothetical protein
MPWAVTCPMPRCRALFQIYNPQQMGTVSNCPACGSPVLLPRADAPPAPAAAPAAPAPQRPAAAPAPRPAPAPQPNRSLQPANPSPLPVVRQVQVDPRPHHPPPRADPPPAFRSDGVTDAPLPDGVAEVPPEDTMYFEGALTPQPALLDGEEVLDRIDTGLSEHLARGFWGIVWWLLGRKERLVLTTHRLFMFEKWFLSNTLWVIWLPRADNVRLKKGVLTGLLLLGVGLVLGGLVLLFLHPCIGLILLPIGVGLILAAFQQELMVYTTGSYWVKFTVLRMSSVEVARFADKLFRQVQWWEHQDKVT